MTRQTISAAKDFPLAVMIAAKRNAERASAQAAAARFAYEIAARQARDARDYGVRVA